MPRDLNDKFTQGDVWGMNESIYTAIYGILVESFPKHSAAYKRSNQSLLDLTRVPDVIKVPRPAIIMEDLEDDDGAGVQVCLATRYEGKDISELPRIFRHFSIPIASNHHVWHGALDHLHSLPEWEKGNAYIIAWPFRSTATRDRPWSKTIDGERIRWVFGRDAMSFLRAEINRIRDEWQEMCKDNELGAALVAELWGHIEQRRKEKEQERSSYGTRNRSSESVTSVNSTWWRSSCRCPETIPEESVNNAFPAAFGKRREPSAKKSAVNPLTASTSSLTHTFANKADGDWISVKSNGSRTSLAQKAKVKGGLLNRFDVLRAVRVNAG